MGLGREIPRVVSPGQACPQSSPHDKGTQCVEAAPRIGSASAVSDRPEAPRPGRFGWLRHGQLSRVSGIVQVPPGRNDRRRLRRDGEAAARRQRHGLQPLELGAQGPAAAMVQPVD